MNIEESKKTLKEELDKLKYEFKIEIPERIAKARAYGDLKENADYDAAMERQAFVKARISQLSHQLSQLNDINMNDVKEDRVGFGSTITVIDRDTDDKMIFTFVSPGDVDPSQGRISLNSPIGSAFNNRTVGEEIEAKTPAGTKKYYIEKLVAMTGSVLEAK